MNEESTRWTLGLFGLLASACIIIQVPLYFIYETPPDWDILTRTLIGIAGCTLFVVWFVGLRHLVSRYAPAHDWLGSILATAGLLWVAMVFVPQSMEAGAAISVDHDIDTTTEGPFAAAQYLMQGAISRMLMALFLITLAVLVRRTGLFRSWVGTSAMMLAVINLAFVPAVYFGDDAADFYSAQGWGTTASMGALWSLWTLAFSISVMRGARDRATVADGGPSLERARQVAGV
jgi:hypothetical protein